MAHKNKKKRLKPEVYMENITYICPVRGEVTQLVKIKRYPSVIYEIISSKETELVAELLDSTSPE